MKAEIHYFILQKFTGERTSPLIVYARVITDPNPDSNPIVKCNPKPLTSRA